MMYKEIITNKKSEVELYFGAEYNSDGALLGFAIIDLDNNRNFYAELIGKNNTSKNTIWNVCRDNARYYSDKSSVGLYDLGMDYACGIYLTIKKIMNGNAISNAEKVVMSMVS